MTSGLKRIKAAPGTELARLLDEAASTPVLLDHRGHLYRLTPEGEASENVWATYDPGAALAGIQAAAGSWNDIDPEAFKVFLYRAREEGSRPPEEP